MNKVAKAKWLRALRSGKYKQGRGLLRTRTGGYCCLGVLCDVYHKTTKKGGWLQEDGMWKFMNRSGVLPDAVRKWARLLGEDPAIAVGVFSGAATSINDKRGSSFKKIADLIEKNL